MGLFLNKPFFQPHSDHTHNMVPDLSRISKSNTQSNLCSQDLASTYLGQIFVGPLSQNVPHPQDILTKNSSNSAGVVNHSQAIELPSPNPPRLLGLLA